MGLEACEKRVRSWEELGAGGAVACVGNVIFLLRSLEVSTGLPTWGSLYKNPHKIHI